MRRVALQEKATLNPEETAQLYDFSRRKLYRLLQQKNLPFVLMYNKRKFVDGGNLMSIFDCDRS